MTLLVISREDLRGILRLVNAEIAPSFLCNQASGDKLDNIFSSDNK